MQSARRTRQDCRQASFRLSFGREVRVVGSQSDDTLYVCTKRLLYTALTGSNQCLCGFEMLQVLARHVVATIFTSWQRSLPQRSVDRPTFRHGKWCNTVVGFLQQSPCQHSGTRGIAVLSKVCQLVCVSSAE